MALSPLCEHTQDHDERLRRKTGLSVSYQEVYKSADVIRQSLSFPHSREDGRFVTAVLNNITYINKGIVRFGLIPSNITDSTGDTIGGIGSAIALKRGTFRQINGSFTGTLLARPDRGFNVDGPIDYQSRQYEIDFVLKPYYGSENLSFDDAQRTLKLTYKETTLQYDRFHKKTSGLDPTSVRKPQLRYAESPFLDPMLPVVSRSDNRLVIDVEGLVADKDGSFWVSDEYGPYIYRFTESGQLMETIQPPEAFLPRDITGSLNFTSISDPITGRSANKGFEGLTIDVDSGVLYAMLQSATIQDGGGDTKTSRYTRLLAYDIRNTIRKARLVGEWVVPLPLSSKGKTLACSEIHFISPGVFLALSRDGDGRGGDDNNSKYKQADLFSILGSTDIHDTKFDQPAHPVSPGGILDDGIIPAEYVSFVDYVDPVQLARFGIHNGKPNNPTLLNAKWESLALVPINDANAPNDYFLITVSDNDFISTQGISLGVPFNAGLDVDNQVLVFRLTLPSVIKGSVHRAIGVSS